MNTAAITVTTLSILAASASGGIAPFQIFENNDGVNTAGINFSVTSVDGGSYIDFVLENNSNDGVATRVLIENMGASSGLGSLTILSTGVGDHWANDANNSTPPGSLSNFGASWGGTLAGLTADPSPVNNGIDIGESLTVRFDLGQTTFQAVNAALEAGEFRFVTHIQSIGASSVWGVTTVVPAPAGFAAFAVASLAATRRRR